MSLFESLNTSFSFPEDPSLKAFLHLDNKENQPTLHHYQAYRIKQLSQHIQQSAFENYQDKEGLSFRAQGLEVQVAEMRLEGVRLREELKLEKNVREEVERELCQLKEERSRGERTGGGSGDETMRRMRLELNEKGREMEATKQELNSERLRGRIESQKEKRRTEEIEDVRRQLGTFHKEFQLNKQYQRQLQLKVAQGQRAILQLRFQKTTLLQQLKFHKSQKQALLSSNSSHDKCQEVITITRQLNQMSLECAKWRTQWEELRREQESMRQQSVDQTSVRQELEEKVQSLIGVIEESKRRSGVCEEEMAKAKVEVAKIQEAEKVRKEEITKKDKYVLRLEAESKKFEEECHQRVREMGTEYQLKIQRLEEQKHFLSKELEKASEVQKTREVELGQMQEAKQSNLELWKTIEDNKRERTNLEEANQSLKQQLCLMSTHLQHLQQSITHHSKATKQISSQLQLKNQQMEELRKTRKDLQSKHQRQIQSIKRHATESLLEQASQLQSQLARKQQEVEYVQEQTQMLANDADQQRGHLEVWRREKEEEVRRLRGERQKWKKECCEAQIRLRVVQSQSHAMQEILSEEMDKRNQVIEQMVRQARANRF